MELEKKYVYAPYVNSDLNEGNGYQYPLAFCQLKATAIRLGKGKDVQGTHADVKEVEIFLYDDVWYGPIMVESPTANDEIVDKMIKEEIELARKKKQIMLKLLDLGISQEEIKTLTGE
jgi:hypothetical protein